MTEDMKRLIKGGKIVGYAWFCVSGVYYYENEIDGIGTDIPMPEFDSFDAGIEVGENTCVECQARPDLYHEHKAEWWLAGDKGDGGEVLCFGEFEYTYRHELVKCYGFYWQWRSGGVCQFYSNDNKNITRVGTIYDKDDK